MSAAPGPAQSRPPPGRYRLLVPALGSWAVTALLVTYTGASVMLALCAAICGSVLLWLAMVGKRVVFRRALAIGVVCCAMLLSLGSRVALLEQQRADATFAEAARQSTALTFEARLTSYPKSNSSQLGERAWVRAKAVSLPEGADEVEQTIAVPVLLWLDAAATHAAWGPGTLVQVRGTPTRQAPADSAAYAVKVQQIGEVPQSPLLSRFVTLAAELRAGLSARCAEVFGAELVPGFAVGDTSLVPEQLNQAMLESSLTHLTAVSGSNTGLVVAAMVWACSRLGMGRRVRTLFAALALGAFLLLVGPDASVQRAAVMAAVLLVSGFSGLRASALPALGAAVFVLLLVDPWQSLQPGFALSVAATLGILLLAKPLEALLCKRIRLPKWLALPVAIAIAAQLACGPFLLLLQQGIPAAGVVANVVAAPAAPLGTGLGLLAALLGPVVPWLAQVAVVLASYCARWVAATATVTAQLPFARWHWPDGWPGAVLLALCQLALAYAIALHRGKMPLPGFGSRHARTPWTRGLPPPQAIRVAIALLTAGATGTAIAVIVVTPLSENLGTPRSWSIVACDVGQGDAILLRDPRRPDRSMLIDTGNEVDMLLRCLKRFDVQRISLLVLTHDDDDHVGALPAIANMVDAALIAPTIRGERFDSRPVVRQLSAGQIPFAIAGAGMQHSGTTETDGTGITWQVLAPKPGEILYDRNSASVVMLAEVSGVSVLLLADTGEDEQRQLLKHQPTLHATVLKVAHHGSKDQLEALTGQLSAKLALISVGAGNRYGHPSAETLGSLSRTGAQVLRTDQLGSIAVVAGAEGSLSVWAERSGAL